MIKRYLHLWHWSETVSLVMCILSTEFYNWFYNLINCNLFTINNMSSSSSLFILISLSLLNVAVCFHFTILQCTFTCIFIWKLNMCQLFSCNFGFFFINKPRQRQFSANAEDIIFSKESYFFFLSLCV